MGVAKGVDELAGLQTRELAPPSCVSERVRRNIERDPEENIGATLIELTRQLSAIGHVELKQAVAGRQGHADRDFRRHSRRSRSSGGEFGIGAECLRTS